MAYRKRAEEQPSLIGLAEGTRSGNPEDVELFYLFLKNKCLPVIKKYLIARGCGEQATEDLFHEGVIILINAIRAGRFSLKQFHINTPESQLCAYLMGIVKNNWKKEIRWQNRDKRLQDDPEETSLDFDLLTSIIKDVFNEMEKEDQQILSLYFQEKLSPRLIAGKLGKKTDEVKEHLKRCIHQFLNNLNFLLDQDRDGRLSDLIQDSLGDLEDRCRTILTLFYFEKNNMSQLAQSLGYANAHSVAEQKSRCMEKLHFAVVNRLLIKKSE